jgi:fatty acid desaturase
VTAAGRYASRMGASRQPPYGHRSRTWALVSDTFWLLVLSVIVLFAFFLALGTFSVGEVGWVSVAVGVLVVLWCVHALLERRHGDEDRDRALTRQRERRGF